MSAARAIRFFWLLGRCAGLFGSLAACAGAPPAGPAARGGPAADPSQICVVRHAEAYKNLSPPPPELGPADLDRLTPAGIAQARALQSALAAAPAVVWTSPRGRARETAEQLQRPVPVGIEPGLRPLDGTRDWDGRLAAWARGEDPRPADGESLADGQVRAVALLARLRARLGPGEQAILVTHGDLAAVILGELRGTTLLDRPVQDEIPTGALRCLPLGP